MWPCDRLVHCSGGNLAFTKWMLGLTSAHPFSAHDPGNDKAVKKNTQLTVAVSVFDTSVLHQTLKRRFCEMTLFPQLVFVLIFFLRLCRPVNPHLWVAVSQRLFLYRPKLHRDEWIIYCCCCCCLMLVQSKMFTDSYQKPKSVMCNHHPMVHLCFVRYFPPNWIIILSTDNVFNELLRTLTVKENVNRCYIKISSVLIDNHFN